MIACRLDVDEAISIHDTETALLAGSCEHEKHTRFTQGVLGRQQLVRRCLRIEWCFLPMWAHCRLRFVCRTSCKVSLLTLIGASTLLWLYSVLLARNVSRMSSFACQAYHLHSCPSIESSTWKHNFRLEFTPCYAVAWQAGTHSSQHQTSAAKSLLQHFTLAPDKLLHAL